MGRRSVVISGGWDVEAIPEIGYGLLQTRWGRVRARAALTAAENRAYYEQTSLSTGAATYAYHLTQAHAFPDGNKRLAAAVAEIFLELNGAELRTTDEEIVAVFLAIAAGEVSRQDVEQWFAQRVVFTQEPSA